ncbi:ATP-binding protein [Caulobacter sp. 17J65-9]|uniref:ATP-binding protein n=1 Tax=Caulobacter sp. 17J65-9 TaxID=2709382 RepID=UPI0013CC3D77|nr:ATP-binding protein [Caulobacter sp. 17J65-9]NEX91459.1 response regulator [Caulobacter sp. 17J65-9]
MPTIDTLTERATPISPETLGADVYARFEREPDTLVIPVVEGDRPVGLVERNAFLVRMSAQFGRELFGKRAITALMDVEPVVVEASTAISTFCDAMLTERASTLMRGFIVTDQGRYLGVGTVLSLLQATSAASRARADELSEVVRSLGEAQTLAQASARAKSQFLAVMSHEIRTPMNGVLAVAELLQRQPLGRDAQAYVQTIVDSSETLLRILSDALDLSRAEAGELAFSPQPTFVRELMDDVQALWAPRAAQDNVSLLVSFDGDPDLAASFDSARLKQVFNNLIGNALKFARNGVVEASLRAVADGADVRLEGSVRDNGPGIPKDKLATIFEPFVHAPGQQYGGSGLGLAICRQIAETMGGRIWADSNPGRGSTFAFEARAPLARLERAGESNVAQLEELQLQAQPHILIVDDNATNRVVAQALCEMFGCTSECAEDGLEAVEAVKSRRFDLVLMDIKMPRMDGVQATKTIRALTGPESEVPIIALTANADPDDAKHYTSIGMACVVEKPIKPERLRAAMNLALAGEAEAEAEVEETGRGRRAAVG